jgi:hypothetical protein
MQIHSTMVLAAVLLAGTVPATAQQVGNGKSASSTAPAASEKKVCRKLVTSGSRFAEKVCLTKAQWEKIDADS